jgi:hypothetical protein
VRLDIVDGTDGAPISPTAVELRCMRATRSALLPEPKLVHGAATFAGVPAGMYRLRIEAEDGRAAERELQVPALPSHTERVAVWSKGSVACTIDSSGIDATWLAQRTGQPLVVELFDDGEHSVAVDGDGARLNLTENTGMATLGGAMTFHLERVTANVQRRLLVVADDIFGEVWFTAPPSGTAAVTLRLRLRGLIEVPAPPSWPECVADFDVHDGDDWRTVSTIYYLDMPPEQRTERLSRGAGPCRWRVRCWPTDGSAMREVTGEVSIAAGKTTTLRVE